MRAPHQGAMATVTVLDVAPPSEAVTGTASPDAAPSGTCALIWNKPTAPGASPENVTFAGTPPMLTTGVRVMEGIVSVLPLKGMRLTRPIPVA